MSKGELAIESQQRERVWVHLGELDMKFAGAIRLIRRSANLSVGDHASTYDLSRSMTHTMACARFLEGFRKRSRHRFYLIHGEECR